MYCFIAKLKIKPGREQEFLKLQQELSDLTHGHEPGTVIYDVLKHETESRSYVYYARFRDKQAFELHQTSAFHDRLIPPIMDCVDGPMDLQFYDFVT